MADSHSEDWGLSEEGWCQRFNATEYQILCQASTERVFTGECTDAKTQGVYRCRACGYELFWPSERFNSHCSWPSLFSPPARDRIIERRDTSPDMVHTEVLYSRCRSHLGHVFEREGYNTPTDLRYYINSISLALEPDETAE